MIVPCVVGTRPEAHENVYHGIIVSIARVLSFGRLARKISGLAKTQPARIIIEEGRKVLVYGQLPNIERWAIMTAVGTLIAWLRFCLVPENPQGICRCSLKLKAL
jgi:hypothetical protein